MNYIGEIFILLFLALTFLQSGYEKIMDWQGNVNWLKEHFAQTFIKNHVPKSLLILLLLEIIAGTLSVAGIIQIIFNNDKSLGFYGAVVSGIALLLMLYGQRIAKDYDGARTIVIYYIPTLVGIFLLN